jgi:hypothetical protein
VVVRVRELSDSGLDCRPASSAVDLFAADVGVPGMASGLSDDGKGCPAQVACLAVAVRRRVGTELSGDDRVA